MGAQPSQARPAKAADGTACLWELFSHCIPRAHVSFAAGAVCDFVADDNAEVSSKLVLMAPQMSAAIIQPSCFKQRSGRIPCAHVLSLDFQGVCRSYSARSDR